jgi:muramoyltetrapeptide carboxypeptidase
MTVRIAVVAPSGAAQPGLDKALAAAVAKSRFAGEVSVEVHPDAMRVSGHFAGTDAQRLKAFLEVANDPSVDAVWALRGGYGSGRLLEGIKAGLKPAARDKTYLGYSDFGFVLGLLYASASRASPTGRCRWTARR